MQMTTKSILKTVLFSAAAAVALAAAPMTASARSVAAHAAGFRAACLVESFGGVFNTCGSTQGLAYSAVIDATNTVYHVTIRGQGPSAQSNVTCWGHGVSEDGTSFWLSNTQSLPFFGPSADLAPLNVFVPSNGVMNIYCSIMPGGEVFGYHY